MNCSVHAKRMRSYPPSPFQLMVLSQDRSHTAFQGSEARETVFMIVSLFPILNIGKYGHVSEVSVTDLSEALLGGTCLNQIHKIGVGGWVRKRLQSSKQTLKVFQN